MSSYWLENILTHSALKVWPSDHREDDVSCVWLINSIVHIFLALWLTRRWGHYDRTCPNLPSGDNFLKLLSSDCFLISQCSCLFILPLHLRYVYCFICGLRRVAIARYWMICIVLGTSYVLGHLLASRRAEHIIFWRMPLYMFDILIYLPTRLCNNVYNLSALVGSWSSVFIWMIICAFLANRDIKLGS